MKPRFPAMRGFNGGQPKGALLHNDDSHNFPDQNRGGGPHGVRNKPAVRPSDRTGAGTRFNGRDPAPSTSLRGREVSGNPGASVGRKGGVGGSGGFDSEGRQSFTPDTRVPGHGGSPQHRERETPGDFHKRGGVGAHGQEFTPGGRQSDTGSATSTGNPGGRSYRLIAGRFKRAAMGARASGEDSHGAYGSPPVTANT